MSLNKLKKTVHTRANGLCEYCKSPANISSQPFVVEHIIPQSKDGATEESNLALACQGCNNFKYNKTSVLDAFTNEKHPLFHPRKQKWDENFAWSSDTLEIIGLTATGRVTIEALKMNRPELINLRIMLSSVGKHPPI
jgi:HNH endonuclease